MQQFCRGNTMNVTYSEWVFVVLDIQPAMCMRRIVLSSAACFTVPYFFTLSHRRHYFRKTVINKICVF
jgi:hypothetical protein